MRADLHRYPPHPPISRLAPILGETRQGRERTIDYLNAYPRGELLKPVDSVDCHHAKRGSAKRRAEFARLELPHFGLFCPHFCPKLPHQRFCGFAPAYLSIYLFSERESDRRGGERAKSAIHTSGFAVTGVSTLFLVYPQLSVDGAPGCKPMLARVCGCLRGNPHIHSQKCPRGCDGR